jgi:hypothetical protein
MYEKPQYLTPDGYKRTNSGSSKEHNIKDSISKPVNAEKIQELLRMKKFLNQSSTSKKSTNANLNQSEKNITKKGGLQISDKAAKLIALAIKDMLRS